MQLNKIPLETYRCSAQCTDQWIEIHAFEEDPQIYLPPVLGKGGKIQLRLSYIADPPNALQIYWAIGDAPFSTDQVQTIMATGVLEAANLVLDIGDGKNLRIRIDPTTGIGHSRLRGSLGGMFALSPPTPIANLPLVPSAPILTTNQNAKPRGRSRAARA